MIDSPQHSVEIGPEKAGSEIAARLTRLVRDLVWELHPEMQRRVAVTLDSDLDRDLGLDSLGRAELVLRIDRAFKVRLPDQLLADASTPRDLLQALVAAAPDGAVATEALTLELTELPEVVVPFSETTLIGVLAHHVHSHGERPHVLLWQSEDEEQTISYAELDRESRSVAARLIEWGAGARRSRGHHAADRGRVL
jgi:acyl carrier protein